MSTTAIFQHANGWQQARRWYRRLEQDTASWPYNQVSAAQLLRNGLESSKIRRRVLQILQASDRPLTPDDILRAEPRISDWHTLIADYLLKLYDEKMVDRDWVAVKHRRGTYLYWLSPLGAQVMALEPEDLWNP